MVETFLNRHLLNTVELIYIGNNELFELTLKLYEYQAEISSLLLVRLK